MKHLDPRQSACFLSAVQTGTVRAAAEQLGLEPSTVSRNISSLEQHLAATLVERGRGGVRPTEAGVLLITFLQKQDGALELLRSDFDALANMRRGKISIAVGEGFVGDLFEAALADFSSRFPDITYSINVGSTEHVVHQVTAEQAHLGLAYNVVTAPKIRVEALSRQPLVILVRKGGVYDSSRAFNLEDLVKMPCAIPPKSFGVGSLIQSIEATQGVRLRARVETGSIAALKAFVRQDMGFTILPRFVVEAELSAGLMSAHSLSFEGFTNGVSYLVRKEGRKLPQPAQLLMNNLKKMSAFS